MSEYLQNVLDLSMQYFFMAKGTLVDVFDRDRITETEKSIDVTAGDLFVKGDMVSMTIDPGTPGHIEIDIPARKIRIASETYGWTKQN